MRSSQCRDARRQYQELFWRAEKVGCRRLVLIGGCELAEIAIMSSRDLDVEVLAIVDTETNRAKLFGVPVVRALSDVAGCDAVIVTDSRQPQAGHGEGTLHLAFEEQGHRVAGPGIREHEVLERSQRLRGIGRRGRENSGLHGR